MYLIGCTYNFCVVHHELSKTSHLGSACTPAMAAGLSDHIWSVCELLSYRIAPPPWIEPKREDDLASKLNPPKPFPCVLEFVSEKGFYAPPFNGVLPDEYAKEKELRKARKRKRK